MAFKATRELFSSIRDEIDSYNGDFKEGLSFLDLKNDVLLSYMIDICNIVLRKYQNQSIEGHPSVDRTVEYRIILEKVKSIDQKLAYQINKLIAMPEDSAPDDTQRINIENLDIDLDGVDSDDAKGASGRHEDPESEDEDDDDQDEDDLPSDISQNSGISESSADEYESRNNNRGKSRKSKQGNRPAQADKKPGIYKPPKLRSVSYSDGKVGGKERGRNHDKFYDEDHQDDVVDTRTDSYDRDRTEYEEENYTRLPVDNPKKAKRKLKAKEFKKKGKKRFKGKR